MLNPSDSTADQLNTIAELKARLKDRKQQRTDAVRQLRECAAQAAQDTPAKSSIFYVKKEPVDKINGAGASGVHNLSGADQVEARKRQLIEQRKKRSEVLAHLKRTSYLVVQKLKPTQYLDPKEVHRRLAVEDLEQSADSGRVDAQGSGNGAVGP